jgi:hypothetical protein
MSAGQLIALLYAVVANNEIEPVLGEDEVLNWGNLEERHKLIQDVTDMATEVLIRENGERDYSAEVQLEMAGFPVRCLEKDSFGWLAGGIETEKGVIAYG